MLEKTIEFCKNYQIYWLAGDLLIILATFLVATICKRTYLFLKKKLKSSWQKVIIERAYPPIKIMIWTIAFLLCLENSISSVLIPDIKYYIGKVRAFSIVALVTWTFFRLSKDIEELIEQKFVKKKQFDITSFRAIINLVKIVVFSMFSLVMLQSIGIPLSGVIAFGGVGGLAVGFAAKDLLANFFGGLMIFLDRPFSIGDWIRSPDREIEGYVEQIGLRHIRIRTFDKRPLYVPNSIFLSISIENATRMENRRILTYIDIRYEDAEKMTDIIKDVEEMVKIHPTIDSSKFLCVKFTEFTQYSLRFIIYAFTKATGFYDYHHARQQVFLEVIEILKKYGAELAYPTSKIRMAEPNYQPEQTASIEN